MVDEQPHLEETMAVSFIKVDKRTTKERYFDILNCIHVLS